MSHVGAVGVAGPLVSITEGRCAVGEGSVVDAGCSLTTAPLSWRSQGVGLRRVTWLVGGEAWPGAAVVGGAVGGGAERCAQLLSVALLNSAVKVAVPQ